MDGSALSIHLFYDLITDGDQEFLPILLGLEKGLGTVVVDGFYNADIPMDRIDKPKPQDFVEVEFIPGKRGQQIQGQKQFGPNDLIGRGLILDLLKIRSEERRVG